MEATTSLQAENTLLQKKEKVLSVENLKMVGGVLAGTVVGGAMASAAKRDVGEPFSGEISEEANPISYNTNTGTSVTRINHKPEPISTSESATSMQNQPVDTSCVNGLEASSQAINAEPQTTSPSDISNSEINIEQPEVQPVIVADIGNMTLPSDVENPNVANVSDIAHSDNPVVHEIFVTLRELNQATNHNIDIDIPENTDYINTCSI